jgi:hypothetical protein
MAYLVAAEQIRRLTAEESPIGGFSEKRPIILPLYAVIFVESFN